MAGPWEKYQKAAQAQPSGPWLKYQQMAQDEGGKTSSGIDSALDSANAFLQSFGNKATAGHLPELQAAAEYLIPNPGADVDRDLTKKGFKVVNKEANFTDRTNQNRADLNALQERNPASTLAGDVAGVLGEGALLSTVAPINAPTALGRIAQAARAGALAGAAQNPAEHQAETQGIQPLQRMEQGAIGAPLGAAIQGLGEGLSYVGTKLGAKIAGVSSKAAETYAERGDEVRALNAKYGGVLPEAADEMKEKVLTAISEKKQELHNIISDELSKPENFANRYQPVEVEISPQGPVQKVASPIDKRAFTPSGRGNPNNFSLENGVGFQPIQREVNPTGGVKSFIPEEKPTVSVQDVLFMLEKERDSLNPHYNPADMVQLNQMIKAIQANATNGEMDLQTLFETRNFLQSRAKNTFVDNGQIFITGPKAARAANAARKMATDVLHETSPNIAQADAIYSELHDVEDKISASLLGTGKPENVFASAGGGQGNVHQMMLEKIGQITGTNPIKDAELLYAAKGMKNDSLIEGARQATLKMALDAKRLSQPLQGPTLYGSTAVIEPVVENKIVPKTAVQRRLAGEKQ